MRYLLTSLVRASPRHASSGAFFGDEGIVSDQAIAWIVTALLYGALAIWVLHLTI